MGRIGPWPWLLLCVQATACSDDAGTPAAAGDAAIDAAVEAAVPDAGAAPRDARLPPQAIDATPEITFPVPPSAPSPPAGAGTPDEGFLTGYIVLDEGPVELCGADVWAGPDSDLAQYRCRRYDLEGPWGCSCDGEMGDSDETYCVDALRARCGVEADPVGEDGFDAVPRTHCVRWGDGEGTCWNAESGGYRCRCGPADGDRALVEVAGGDCAVALFDTCAAGCQGGYGVCETNAAAGADHYTCDCVVYDGARSMEGGSCEIALRDACDPEARCNVYTGYCDVADDETASCHCQDEPPVEYPAPDPGLRYDCKALAQVTCGAGDPPPDKVCDASRGAATARCAQPLFDDEAPFACTCSAPFTGESSAPHALHCDLALLRSCPSVATADAAARDAACAFLASCAGAWPGLDATTCAARASTACVACTERLRELVEDGEACALHAGATGCSDVCNDVVPPPASVEECVAFVDDHGEPASASRAHCMCEACLESFAACIVDPGCVEIADCAEAAGCSGVDCYPACGAVIDRHGQLSPATTKALALGRCPAADDCAP